MHKHLLKVSPPVWEGVEKHSLTTVDTKHTPQPTQYCGEGLHEVAGLDL